MFDGPVIAASRLRKRLETLGVGVHRSALVLASGVVVFSMSACGSNGDVTESMSSEEYVGSSIAPAGPVSPGGLGGAPPQSLPSFDGDPELDLVGVPEASVPLVLTQYLEHVAMAVADDVGPALYVGSQIDLPDSPDVAVTIFGTDVQRLSDALDRIAAQERDRFTVMASEYSRSELEQLVTDADDRLVGAGIEATAWVGLGHIDVFVVAPDGQPDPELERATRVILGDLPFEIEFISPIVPLDS
jgi:hypothetical protein